MRRSDLQPRPRPPIHAAECECAACVPHCRNGGADALAIAALTLALVAVTLVVVWAGARLDALFSTPFHGS